MISTQDSKWPDAGLTDFGAWLRRPFRNLYFGSKGWLLNLNDRWGWRRIKIWRFEAKADRQYGFHASLPFRRFVLTVYQHPVGTWHFERVMKDRECWS